MMNNNWTRTLVAQMVLLFVCSSHTLAKSPVTPDSLIGEDGTRLSAYRGTTRSVVAHPSAASRGGLNVAIVASASGDVTDPFFTDPQTRLFDSGFFASVSAIHAGQITPSVKELMNYDAILVWTNFDLADPVELGDNLADYVNAGGGVVLAVFANSSASENRFVDGRWRANDYAIIPPKSGTTTGEASLSAIAEPDHPLMDGIADFSGGSNSFRPQALVSSVAPNVTVVAEWNDGDPVTGPWVLAAVREDTVGARVDLGFYPVSDAVLPGYWDSTTDGGAILADALLYAAVREPLAPGDSDADGDVDAADLDAFEMCFTGPDGTSLPAGCVTFDFDRDEDVDCSDWNEFLLAWTVEGDPPLLAQCNFAAPTASPDGTRYIAVTAPPVAAPIALFVKGSSDDPDVACVASYVQSDGTLGPEPLFQTVDAWDITHVYGPEIVPGKSFYVFADHGTPGEPLLSPPVTLTMYGWGDVNGDEKVDISDIFCVIDGFQSVFANCSEFAANIIPDEVIDISDIFAVIDAFQGTPFPDPPPCN